jgi:hypothetical protein
MLVSNSRRSLPKATPTAPLKLPKGLEENRTFTTLRYMTCSPQNLKAGQEAVCRGKIPAQVTVNGLPDEKFAHYDVTYKNSEPKAKAAKNVPVEIIGKPKRLSNGEYEVRIRALKDAYVGPIKASGAQVPSPIFLESIGTAVAVKKSKI